jgi:hypothetical protein
MKARLSFKKLRERITPGPGLLREGLCIPAVQSIEGDDVRICTEKEVTKLVQVTAAVEYIVGDDFRTTSIRVVPIVSPLCHYSNRCDGGNSCVKVLLKEFVLIHKTSNRKRFLDSIHPIHESNYVQA